MVLIAFSAQTWAAQHRAAQPRAKTEILMCRSGTEDRHARIAVVLVGGKTDSFAYYSKWKPRTCSIYLQRQRDAYSRWRDSGALTTVSLEQGQFLIEHRKGEYRFVFRNIDRERYCGMEGFINGSLTIRKGNERCEIAGIMHEGAPLGQAYAQLGAEGAALKGETTATPAANAAATMDVGTARAAAGSTPWYVRFWENLRSQSQQPVSAWPVPAD